MSTKPHSPSFPVSLYLHLKIEESFKNKNNKRVFQKLQRTLKDQVISIVALNMAADLFT